MGDWGIERGGEIVATGGVFTHYNPPYGDVYMEVNGQQRGQGVGSYLVQELKRVAYESGLLPAARCSPENAASRATLERAGLQVCGQTLSGTIRGA